MSDNERIVKRMWEYTLVKKYGTIEKRLCNIWETKYKDRYGFLNAHFNAQQASRPDMWRYLSDQEPENGFVLYNSVYLDDENDLAAFEMLRHDLESKMAKLEKQISNIKDVLGKMRAIDDD